VDDLLPILFPILLIDILNPVLFAIMLAGIGSSRPVLNSSAILAGHTAAYFLSGIVLALGIEKITTRLTNPEPIDFIISSAVGLACVYAAWASRNNNPSKSSQREAALTPANSFGIGAIVNFAGVPFAVPYFAAINQILRADLPPLESLAALIGYNLAYASPFAIIPLLYTISGNQFKPVLEKVNDILIKITNFILPLLLGLLGLVLIVDSVLYFSRGRGLY